MTFTMNDDKTQVLEDYDKKQEVLEGSIPDNIESKLRISISRYIQQDIRM